MPRRAPYGQHTGMHVVWVTVRRRTIYVATAVLVGALGLSAGLYFWLTRPAESSETEPAAEGNVSSDSATFLELNGTVKVRKAGTYQWIDAHEDIALQRNDTVRTVGTSSARIRLFDGTEYFVKPDTIFLIEVMHEDPRTKVRKVAVKLTAGQVNLQTPRRNVAGSSSELATPTAEATFDELTTADVGYDQSRGVSDFAVYRGSTHLRTGDREVNLGQSQAVEVRNDQTFSEVIHLPGVPALESPAHLSRLFYSDPGRETTELRWKPVPDARSYHVMLDRSPNFDDPQEYRVRGLRVLVPGLTPGTYYWWVSAIDARSREGGFSDFAKFTITTREVATEPPKLVVSQPAVSIDGVVTLNGVTDPDAVVTINDQRVTVKPDGSFRHYFTVTEPGRHPIVVKAHKRSGGTAEKTVFATLGLD